MNFIQDFYTSSLKHAVFCKLTTQLTIQSSKEKRLDSNSNSASAAQRSDKTAKGIALQLASYSKYARNAMLGLWVRLMGSLRIQKKQCTLLLNFGLVPHALD
jgi:hypothetical protein